MKKLLVIVGIFALLFAYGCPKSKSEQVESGQKAGAGGSGGRTVLAKVGDFEITDEYIDKVLESLPENLRSQYLTPEGKRILVDSLVDMEVFYLEAKSKGLDRDPQVAFKIDFAKKQLISGEYVEREMKNIAEPTDADAEKYYKDNKEMFKRPAQARVKHILVNTREDAEKIKEELEKGADFAKLASEKSRDGSRVRGGELGWLEKGQTIEQFDQAIFSIPLDKPTVVETRAGFHVVQVLERRGEGYRDLAEVKDEILSILRHQIGQKQFQELASSLRKKYNARVFQEAFIEQEFEQQFEKPLSQQLEKQEQ